jgi:hypothetical protein
VDYQILKYAARRLEAEAALVVWLVMGGAGTAALEIILFVLQRRGARLDCSPREQIRRASSLVRSRHNRAAEEQKEGVGRSAGFYKQATPTGFGAAGWVQRAYESERASCASRHSKAADPLRVLKQ